VTSPLSILVTVLTVAGLSAPYIKKAFSQPAPVPSVQFVGADNDPTKFLFTVSNYGDAPLVVLGAQFSAEHKNRYYHYFLDIHTERTAPIVPANGASLFYATVKSEVVSDEKGAESCTLWMDFAGAGQPDYGVPTHVDFGKCLIQTEGYLHYKACNADPTKCHG
jgi:hypothetical protein